MNRICVALATMLACGPAFAQGRLPSPQFAGLPIVTQTVVQTVQVAAYGTGNAVGIVVPFSTAARLPLSSGYVTSLTIAAPDVMTSLPTLDVVFLSAPPSASTITDRAGVVIGLADQANIVPGSPLHISDCTSYGMTLCKSSEGIQIPFTLISGTTLYAVIVARNAFTPGGTAWKVTLQTVQN